MAVLYCFVSNIIHYNGAFNPNSVTFTLYYCITYRISPPLSGCLTSKLMIQSLLSSSVDQQK